MKRPSALLLLPLIVPAFSPMQASAAVSVGVDFYSSDGGWQYHEDVASSAQPDRTVPSGVIPQLSWNPVRLTSGTPSAGSLVDSTGSATTMGFSVSASAFTWNNVFNVETTVPVTTAEARNNARLQISQIGGSTGTTAAVSVTGIPYGTYDLIVLLGMDANGRVGRLTLDGASPATYYYSTVQAQTFLASPVWSAASATTYTAGDVPASATYAVFSGLTGATQSFTLAGVTGNVGFTGFQVVAVPEPTALSMLGGLALAGLRRRRRSAPCPA